MRGFSILASVIGLAIAAVWYIPAMYWGYQITNESQKMVAGEESNFANLLRGPAPLRWLRDRAELKNTYSEDELNGERTVSYSVSLPFSEIMKPGEEMPDEAYYDLYAIARAPQFLSEYCVEILGNFAKSCDVGRVRGEVNREGVATMQGELNYIPAYDYGDPSTVENGDLVRARVTILDRYESERPNSPETRAEVLAAAITLCEAVKQTFGNCMITDINLRPHTNYRDEAEMLSATASITILADKTQYRSDSVQAEVNRVAERVL
ncbi:hypothetical protein CLV80_104187 [Yoonia maritima]|uniref:Uncharacterized protein n=1 Tax=Yoonia maritima TaxID=1435347 RepID=A0A2T0W076_9RHOB|nr:hypothetical protein [Yoonia maritima]PRY78222.1 hypothetical protein CLV80_104187 [Yoonia maritima]